MDAAGSAQPPESACLDESAVVELITGEVDVRVLNRAEEHIDQCADCAKLVARVASTPRNDGAAKATRLGQGDGKLEPSVADAGVAPASPAPASPVPASASGPARAAYRQASPADATVMATSQHAEWVASEPPPVELSAAPSLQPGTILRDTYRIVRHLEKGGMGEVYEAKHARLSGRYAVKVLPQEFAAHKIMLSRFRREAQIASGLQHPNVVQVIDFHETDDGRPYLVMEYLDGENLARWMNRHGPLTPAEALPIIQQIAAGLGAVHRQGVVHRDIKPQNVFVVAQPDGTPLVKLLDFGISKGSEVSSVVTRQQALMGTPQYMAPEQALRRSSEIGPATDQFALGAILYEMLAGRPAFEGPLVSVVLYHIVHEAPAPLGVPDPDGVLARVEPVLNRALAKTPGERYPSMAEFSAALSAAVAGNVAPVAAVALPAPSAMSAPTPAAVQAAGASDVARDGDGDVITAVVTTVPTPRRRSWVIPLVVAGGVFALGVLFMSNRWRASAHDATPVNAAPSGHAASATPTPAPPRAGEAESPRRPPNSEPQAAAATDTTADSATRPMAEASVAGADQPEERAKSAAPPANRSASLARARSKLPPRGEPSGPATVTHPKSASALTPAPVQPSVPKRAPAFVPAPVPATTPAPVAAPPATPPAHPAPPTPRLIETL